IDKILAPIEQFLSLMENIDFAHAGPSLSLPKLPEKINSTPVPGLEKPKENIVNDVAMPTIDKSTENTVIEQIKRFTGYSRWEEFKENFKNNMGSGECMVKISDFCLVRW
ncbi:MAG: hypothetical protein U9M89_01265, partial [Patescibacteria group bacterium]|nr:hypothetical protein [Patescibacteria group bacterium]